MLATLADAFPRAEDDLPEEPVARAQIQRQNMIAFEPEPSPMAAEATIPGPSGDIPGPASDIPGPASDIPGPAGDFPGPAGDFPGPAGDIPSPASDIPVGLFEPEEPKAMFLHLHGGGWVVGRPRINDAENEHLANHHGLAVLSVDYRLAPEHPYPVGLDDCEAAASW